MRQFRFVLLVLVLSSSNVVAATWTQTINNPTSGDLISIDLGAEVSEITGITILSSGNYVSRMRTCDTPGGPYTYSIGHDLDLRILDSGVDQFRNIDYLPCHSSSFELLWLIEASDTADFSFLNDGIADLLVNYERSDDGRCGEDRPCDYCCWTSQVGSFTFESLTIIIDYDATVKTESLSWDKIKATYR